MLAPWKKSYDQTRQHIKKQRHYLANESLSSQSYGFPSGHVWMWELDHKESWAPKDWYFWTVVLEKTLESPLDWKTWQQAKCLVLKEISPEYSLEGLMLKLKLWYLATWCKELILWKRPWCWERLKAGGEGDDRGWDGWWHRRLNGLEFDQAVWVGGGQGGLACCGPWGHRESDTTERLDWTGRPDEETGAQSGQDTAGKWQSPGRTVCVLVPESLILTSALLFPLTMWRLGRCTWFMLTWFGRQFDVT